MILADPGVGARRGTGRVGVVDLASSRSPSLAFYLEPPSPIGLFMGVDVSIVRYPILSSSQPEGLSFVACPDRSGSSDALGEFANGYDQVESRFVVHDRADIALL